MYSQLAFQSNKSLMRINFIVTFFIQLLSLQVSILYSLHIGKAFPNGIGEFQKLGEKCRKQRNDIAFILMLKICNGSIQNNFGPHAKRNIIFMSYSMLALLVIVCNLKSCSTFKSSSNFNFACQLFTDGIKRAGTDGGQE